MKLLAISNDFARIVNSLTILSNHPYYQHPHITCHLITHSKSTHLSSTMDPILAPYPAEVYDTDRFAELYSQSRKVDEEHLALATKYLIGVFQQYDVPYAVLGGWAVYLRGNRRATQDVDVAVRSPMEIIKAVLLLEQR